MTRQDLKNYLIEEAEYREAHVNDMNDTELLNSWLVYNGICGYTDDILDIVHALGL